MAIAATPGRMTQGRNDIGDLKVRRASTETLSSATSAVLILGINSVAWFNPESEPLNAAANCCVGAIADATG